MKEPLNKEILKDAIKENLTGLSSWTDNGECREYNDIDKESIANDIIKDYEAFLLSFNKSIEGFDF